MDLGPIDELDASATLAAASCAVRARRAAEVQDLLVLSHWAALHGSDPRRGPGGERVESFGNRLVDLGGEGTPMVQEFCIGELAIGISQALWEDITVNTMIPGPTEETSADGEFRFVFAELAPGAPFLMKVDLQVNPDILGGNEGVVTVYDCDEALTSVPVSITVLP